MRIHGPLRSVTLLLLTSALLHGAADAEAISLQQAVEQALKCNPTIAAGQLSAAAACESARGARALTNPELLVAPTVIGEGGSDSAALFLQPLEINGARTARSRIAAGEASAASYDSEAVRRDTTLQVKHLYWGLAEAQEVVKLNEENVAYLEALDKAIRKQVEVGKIPGSQTIKSDVELSRARQELDRARLEQANARAALAAVLNCPADRDLSASDPLACRRMAIDRAALVSAALKSRPEVLAKSAQVEASRGRISAARARRIPDLALQARKESFDGGDSGVAISVTLPLLDWGSAKADKRSAQIESAAKLKELEAARTAVVLDVEQAVQALDTATRVVKEYEGGILDKSTQLAAMAQKGYEKGAMNYLDVLEAQRTLRSVRTEYFSALAAHAKSVAKLEWAAGVNLGPTEVTR